MRYNWPEVKLSELCSYRQERVAVDELTVENYISTANMLPNKGGIEPTESLPSSSTANRYYAGDVLISNIRPYFKKAWYATTDGGCSSDVLVLRAKGDVHPEFLYYLLTSDTFFSYMTATSKGTKMPRGDKQAIMNWRARKPPLPTQRAIADTLSCLDAKIALNKRINENLEEQAQAIFKSWFVDFEPFHDGEFVDSVIGPIPKGWKACAVTDVIDVNPKRKLDKGTSAKYLSMANVSTSGPRVLGWEQRNFTSGTCFMNGDVLLARITPSLEHGKTAFVDFLADQEVGWGSTEFIVMRSREPLPLEYTYCLAKHEPFREHMIKSMTGTSGRQRAQVDALKHYFLAIAPKDVYAEFQEIVIPFFLAIRRNATENQVLAALRDTLLPKLMSGEIEVPVV